jgi:hypothetical protein
MGEKRFAQLESQLPAEVVVLGIDEHTACTIDFAAGECVVKGAGGITIRRGGEERSFASGSSCAIDELRVDGGARARPAAEPERLEQDDALQRLHRETDRAREHSGNGSTAPTGTIALALASAIDEGSAAGVEDEALATARAALADYLRTWEHALTDDAEARGEIAPFIDLMMEIRARLRAEGAFGAADAIRDGLAGLGIALEDSSTGTSWRRRDG